MTIESWAWAVLLACLMTTGLSIRDVIEMREMRRRVDALAKTLQEDIEALRRRRSNG